MKMWFKVIWPVALVFGFIQAAVLPVEKCKLSDSTCMVPAFQKMMPIFMGGMPEDNVDVLDPMEMSDLAFDLAGLQFTLTGAVMKGLKSSVVDKVDWDTDKQTFTVVFHMDISVKGHYTASGRILILPITGDGQMKLKLKNLEIKIHIDYDVVKGPDGKDVIKPKKHTYEYEVKDNAHYYLGNLFNGNKELSEPMLAFLNDNWKQIATEFGGPMMTLSANTIYKNVVKFFESKPLEDIAIV